MYNWMKKMPVLSKYAKQHIIALKGEDLNHCGVVHALRKEGISTSYHIV